jgi:L-ascorbate metabolism protein UlaG (beta-lactamase superfamily)
MRSTRSWCRVLACVVFLGESIAFAESVPVSDSMSLEEIHCAMEVYPPRWEFGDQRAAITASLDKHITVQIHKGWTLISKRQLQPVHEFYLKRMDVGLDKLERTQVTHGVHVFKFYSSSYILKTAQGTVAVEFSQGPINNGGEPETRDEYGSGFYWRADQRERLAKTVDAYIITHRHHDHSDYSLAKRMTAAGKPVICPAQLKTIWKDFADKLIVPDYGKPQKFGPLEIFTMLGSQMSRNEPTGNGEERRGVPNTENPERDSETICYLFKLAGITFITCGENHVPADEWLREGVALGFKPNVRMSLGQFQGDRAMVAALKTMKPVFRLPLHEYEMMHSGGGNRTGYLMQDSNRKSFDQRRMMPMLWGEDFLITDETVTFTR